MGSPNKQASNKWLCEFSNIPSITDYRNMNLYNYYVRSCVIPDYNVSNDTTSFMSSTIRHPISKANEDLTPLQIEFVVSEDMENYTNFVEFMQQMRYGSELTEDFLRKNVIKKINVLILDNQKRTKKIVYFTNAFLTNLSSLSLIYGSHDESFFTATFDYEEMKISNP